MKDVYWQKCYIGGLKHSIIIDLDVLTTFLSVFFEEWKIVVVLLTPITPPHANRSRILVNDLDLVLASLPTPPSSGFVPS